MLTPASVLGYTGFYSVLHLLVEQRIIPLFDPKIIENLDENDRIDFPEKIPSTINGLITGLLGLYVVFWEGAFKRDVINPYPYILDTLFGNYVGYTIYDLFVMWRKPKEDTTMWIHHFVGLIGAGLIPIFKRGAFFPTLFTITEITVIPSNLVWYLQRLDMKETKLYEFGLAFRVVVFCLFRPLMAPFCLYYSINNPGPLMSYTQTNLSKYVDKVELSENIIGTLTWSEKFQVLLANLKQIPPIVLILSLVFVGIFGLFNIFWSLRIVLNYKRRILILFNKKVKSPSASEPHQKKAL